MLPQFFSVFNAANERMREMGSGDSGSMVHFCGPTQKKNLTLCKGALQEDSENMSLLAFEIDYHGEEDLSILHLDLL